MLTSEQLQRLTPLQWALVGRADYRTVRVVALVAGALTAPSVDLALAGSGRHQLGALVGLALIGHCVRLLWQMRRRGHA